MALSNVIPNQTQFGTANAISTMPALLSKPDHPSGVVHFEAFCSVPTASATIQFWGSVSGMAYTKIGSDMTFTSGTATTPQVAIYAGNTGVNYSYYKCVVTAISGGSVSAFMGN